ncbi:hypothetical protein DFP78_101252 [Photobacterium lutimaris]|nr:hypothetical protein DFP78_101252 [Photobacterium lutimaris]
MASCGMAMQPPRGAESLIVHTDTGYDFPDLSLNTYLRVLGLKKARFKQAGFLLFCALDHYKKSLEDIIRVGMIGGNC